MKLIPSFSYEKVLKLTGVVAMLGLLVPAALPSIAHAADDRATMEGKGKTLVVYFSLPETDKPDNMSREEDNSVVVINGKVLGNTQYIAQLIQQMTNADIFRIEAQKPYTTDHDALVDLAKEELNRNARPAIAGKIDNIAEYETVFIGYPNWWADMPMILYTFLESYDLAGKTVIAFNTHGGSGFSNTISSIARLQPKARVLEDGFTISRNRVDQAEASVATWLTEIGYKK